MDNAAIFAATLGLSTPWQISEVSLSGEENRIDFTVCFVLGSASTCSCCGEAGKTSQVAKETWVHDDYFGRTAYIHALVPYITCIWCGTKPAERPWARANSRFTLIERAEEG